MEANRTTAVIAETGCLAWLGPVDEKGPYTRVGGRKARVRRLFLAQHHGREPPRGHVEAVCARVLDRPGAPSICVSPHHAISRGPSRLADRLELDRRDFRALRDAMASLGRRLPAYPLRWSVLDLAAMRADPDELARFAADHEVSYWLAWAAWSELSRQTWRDKTHGRIAS